MSTSADGLSNLITTYQSEPERTGNELAGKLMELITDNSVKNHITRAAGPHQYQISISIEDLIEEVRQEAMAKCLTKFRSPGFQVLTDGESAAYVFRVVKSASNALVDRHLGTRRPNGQGRTKDLSSSPFKWGTEETDTAGAAAVQEADAEVDSLNLDPAYSEHDIGRFLEDLRTSDVKLYDCLQLVLQGYSQKEMADKLGIDDRAVRYRIAKAKKAISEL